MLDFPGSWAEKVFGHSPKGDCDYKSRLQLSVDQ